ncbi:hypothetical protein ITG08_20410 [Vibrio cyclitrophicus]|uniref:hypothetical protein n=1 Tax=Vibrio cyclitrophicus TaxID=47951 RepID=UPI00205FBD5C|nr:hypothetical protein [Vibrio cyclitrophicus]UPR26976.1 hypothetical protein ITG08_20410 [Vibrio cyclitrophicus]
MTTQIQLRKSTDIILKKSDKIFSLTSKILNKSVLSIAVNSALAIHDDSEILELMKWLDEQDLLPHYVLAQKNEWVNDAFESYTKKNSYIPRSVIDVVIQNPFFNITDEFIEKFQTQIDWELLVNQEHFTPTLQLFTYSDNFCEYRRHDIKRTLLRRSEITGHDVPQNTEQGYPISANVTVDWSIDFIVKHEEHLCFRELSKNPAILFTNELVIKYADKWDYEELAKNPAMKWSKELMEALCENHARFRHDGVINILVKHPEIFDVELVIRLMTADNVNMFGSISVYDLLHAGTYDYRDAINKWFELNIKDFDEVRHDPEEILQRNLWLLKEGLICAYPDFPWSMKFISDNAQHFEWREMSHCPFIKWDFISILEMEEYIVWNSFGNELNFDGDLEVNQFLDFYSDKINWRAIAFNKNFALDIDQCKEYASYIIKMWEEESYHQLLYRFIDWNIETMELFKDHIKWKDFLEQEDVHVPYQNDQRTKELMDWVFENHEAEVRICDYKMGNILSKLESADELKCFFEFGYDHQNQVDETIFLYSFTQMVKNNEWKGDFSKDFMKMISENDTGHYRDLWIHYSTQDWKEIDKEFIEEYRFDLFMEKAAATAIARLYPIGDFSLDKLKELTKEVQKEKLLGKLV